MDRGAGAREAKVHAAARQVLIARDLVVVPTAYAASSSTHPLSLLGSTRTYIAVWGGGTTGYQEVSTTPANVSVCIRWE